MATLDISGILSARRKSRQMTKLAFARLLVVLAAPFSLRYFYWRAGSTMNPAARWFFYLFFAVELLNCLEALLFYFTTWKLVDVFTNRWCPQGGKISPAQADGAFSGTVQLGGKGRQQCYHLVRARLYDDHGQRQAVAMQYGIARANPDGAAPNCP